MTATGANSTNSTTGKIFGVPLGDFGFISSLLLALTAGFLTFFLTTFLAIIGIMIYNGMGHSMNYADSYKLISFPIACVMLAASLIFFATLWLRRKFSGS
jgi:hypothetical protein